MKLKQLFSLLSAAILFLTCFTESASAISATDHDYAVQRQYNGVSYGATVASHLPVFDIQDKPGSDYFITKETWIGFSSPGAGKYRWIEVGAIKGTNIASIGTHRGYFYGWNTCPSNCVFYGAKYGSGDKDGDQDSVYQISKYGTEQWKVYVNSTLAATSPFDNYEAGVSSDVGIENVASSSSTATDTFNSGTTMYGWQGRTSSTAISALTSATNFDTKNSRTPVYPSNMGSSFATNSGGNIITFSHN